MNGYLIKVFDLNDLCRLCELEREVDTPLNPHIGGRKGEAGRFGLRATNVNNPDQPFTFAPRQLAGNHRTYTANTEAAV
jgi:hypothetical protein